MPIIAHHATSQELRGGSIDGLQKNPLGKLKSLLLPNWHRKSGFELFHKQLMWVTLIRISCLV
jgi:hypothetical protein